MMSGAPNRSQDLGGRGNGMMGGGNGRGGPAMARSLPPNNGFGSGRRVGRGGGGGAPFNGVPRGRGPPPPHMQGRGGGGPMRPGMGRSMGRRPSGGPRGNAMGRGPNMPGRGRMQGRLPMMGRGPPPGPPRMGMNMNMNNMNMNNMNMNMNMNMNINMGVPPPHMPPGRGMLPPPPPPPHHLPGSPMFHNMPPRNIPPPPIPRNFPPPPPPIHQAAAPPFNRPPPPMQFGAPNGPPQPGHATGPPPPGMFSNMHAPPPNPFGPGPQVQLHQQSLAAAGGVVPAGGNDHNSGQISQSWTEHTSPTGIKYYHNSITKESTYTKPGTANAPSQTNAGSLTAIAASPNSASTGTAGNSPAPGKNGWVEYIDSASSKKYYSNGVTTTWERPADFGPVETSDSQLDEPPKRKKAKLHSRKESPFESKDEAIASFKGMLLAKGVAPSLKWNEVIKACSSDSRWEACEENLTVGERKQALAEYQTKRANELRKLERQERSRAKEAFGQLLTENLSSVRTFSAWNSKFADVRETLSKDDRFFAVEDEKTREALFHEFCEEFRKREERKKRSRRREVKEAFLSMLKEKEEAGSLTFASTWDSFTIDLTQADRDDARFAVSSEMSDSDRQLYFADFVIELQAAEDEKRRRIRDARRRAEKAQRDAYRTCLRKLAQESVIFPDSRWRAIEERISDEDAFNLVYSQDQEAPHELFEEFLDEWNEAYMRDRSFLGRVMRSSTKQTIAFRNNLSYDEFKEILLNEAADSPDMYKDVRHIINTSDPVSSAYLYFDDLYKRRKAGSDANRDGDLQNQPDPESSEDEGEIKEDDDNPSHKSENIDAAEVSKNAPTEAPLKEDAALQEALAS